MKEANKRRKIALKKAKEKRTHRQELKKDIAQFMVDFFMDNTENYREMLEKDLMEGFIGFGNMRNAKLVKQFDDLHKRLRSKKEPKVTLCHDTGYPRRREVLEGQAYDDRLAAYQMVAESLMSRLFEVAFDLDFE